MSGIGIIYMYVAYIIDLVISLLIKSKKLDSSNQSIHQSANCSQNLRNADVCVLQLNFKTSGLWTKPQDACRNEKFKINAAISTTTITNVRNSRQTIGLSCHFHCSTPSQVLFQSWLSLLKQTTSSNPCNNTPGTLTQECFDLDQKLLWRLE